MKLKLAKCEFLRDKIQFLGHVIDHKGIRTIPEKTKEISKIKSPANVDQAKAFLEYSTITVDSSRRSLTSCIPSRNS